MSAATPTASTVSTAEPPSPVEQVLDLAAKLTAQDKIRVIADLAQQLREQSTPPPAKKPHRSLWGALADLGPAPSAEEIDEARREAWANFPREDF